MNICPLCSLCVFSTYVEVILLGIWLVAIHNCILHVCGGDPVNYCKLVVYCLYSPRMWRWSHHQALIVEVGPVFSTYVEVIPPTLAVLPFKPGILHVCGGDPKRVLHELAEVLYSPRMWRWSLSQAFFMPPQKVFSTYVEVILFKTEAFTICLCILHVCGGDPEWQSYSISAFQYSPRMWRWSSLADQGILGIEVFSTYVEVILRLVKLCLASWSILHVCGGDPMNSTARSFTILYSPRMWRWSCYWSIWWFKECVFSTYVEVILRLVKLCLASWSILHVCGGDPMNSTARSFTILYSPRMWRWSCYWSIWWFKECVFSTYVEVIPRTTST